MLFPAKTKICFRIFNTEVEFKIFRNLRFLETPSLWREKNKFPPIVGLSFHLVTRPGLGEIGIRFLRRLAKTTGCNLHSNSKSAATDADADAASAFVT